MKSIINFEYENIDLDVNEQLYFAKIGSNFVGSAVIRIIMKKQGLSNLRTQIWTKISMILGLI